MVIGKILNNNAVLTRDENGKELIVMGKAIAYGKKAGEEIDEKLVNKKFIISSAESRNRLIQLVNEIPLEVIEVAEKIIDLANQELNIKMNQVSSLLLSDHIHLSINRYRENIQLINSLQWELKSFYPDEFQVGLKAKQMIEEAFDLQMKEDEAGFITMYFISGESGKDMNLIFKSTSFIQEVIQIVKYYFKVEFNENSLDYYRFIKHLKFFSQYIFERKGERKTLLGNDLLEVIKDKYVEPYLCSLKIKQFIESKYDYLLDDDEILYLTIHIARITH